MANILDILDHVPLVPLTRTGTALFGAKKDIFGRPKTTAFRGYFSFSIAPKVVVPKIGFWPILADFGHFWLFLVILSKNHEKNPKIRVERRKIGQSSRCGER